jgi:hypothetical protein
LPAQLRQRLARTVVLGHHLPNRVFNRSAMKLSAGGLAGYKDINKQQVSYLSTL